MFQGSNEYCFLRRGLLPGRLSQRLHDPVVPWSRTLAVRNDTFGVRNSRLCDGFSDGFVVTALTAASAHSRKSVVRRGLVSWHQSNAYATGWSISGILL